MEHRYFKPSAYLTITAKLWRVHWPLVLVTAILAAVGSIALYSAAGGSLHPWAEQHATRYLVGLGLLLAAALLPVRFWLGAAYPAYLITLLALFAVMHFGTEAMGARRWLRLGGMAVQPSEAMKIVLVLALARYYHDLPSDRVSRPSAVLVPLLAIVLPIALVLRQPDLGTALLLMFCGLVVMFLAGVRLLYFIAGAVLAAVVSPLAWYVLHDYQRQRLLTFLNPEADPSGAGYHILQSKIALGSGGLTGKGFMLGTQSRLGFLPEKHTDFVFTMFAEEMGFVGAAALLMLFALLIALLLWMAVACRHRFGRLLIAGIASGLFAYVFVNIAMVSGMVPVVGVPLPLVSYGGSAMLAVMLGLGMAMNAHVHYDARLQRLDLPLIVQGPSLGRGLVPRLWSRH